MTALAAGIGHNGGPPLDIARPKLWLPKFEPWRILRPLKMFDGQFRPGQRFQFQDGDLSPSVLSAGLSALTFVDVATSSASDTCNLPTGSAAGDLCILVDIARAFGDPGEVTPTGWTQITTGTSLLGVINGDFRWVVSRQVLNASDVSAGSITGMTGTQRLKCIFGYRPDAAITTVTHSTWNKQGTSGNPSLQTVSASGVQVPLVVIGVCMDNNAVPNFSTASPAFDAETTVSDTSGMRVGRKLYNSSPADHSIDMNDEGGNNILLSGYVRVE